MNYLVGTAGESFGIRRSADGRQWSRLATVKGKGVSATKQTYDYTDASPLLPAITITTLHG